MLESNWGDYVGELIGIPFSRPVPPVVKTFPYRGSETVFGKEESPFESLTRGMGEPFFSEREYHIVKCDVLTKGDDFVCLEFHIGHPENEIGNECARFRVFQQKG